MVEQMTAVHLNTSFQFLKLEKEYGEDRGCNEILTGKLRAEGEYELLQCQKFLDLLKIGFGRSEPERNPKKKEKEKMQYPFTSVHFCKCSHFWEKYQGLLLFLTLP